MSQEGFDVVFRRRNKDDAGDGRERSPPSPPSPLPPVPRKSRRPPRAAASVPAARAAREGGPWDSAEAPDDKVERVDLGGVLIPIVDGMELRAEIAEERVVAATLIIERSAIQIQPFAAPRTMGIWEEVRQEIASGITQGGGEVQEAEGRFGTELVATVPVGLPDGTQGMQVARFLGVDGPRWFLRAVITGEGALEENARRAAGEPAGRRGRGARRGRDGSARPHRAASARGGHRGHGRGRRGESDEEIDEAEAERRARLGDFNPFERGPEITEIR